MWNLDSDAFCFCENQWLKLKNYWHILILQYSSLIAAVRVMNYDSRLDKTKYTDVFTT